MNIQTFEKQVSSAILGMVCLRLDRRPLDFDSSMVTLGVGQHDDSSLL